MADSVDKICSTNEMPASTKVHKVTSILAGAANFLKPTHLVGNQYLFTEIDFVETKEDVYIEGRIRNALKDCPRQAFTLKFIKDGKVHATSRITLDNLECKQSKSFFELISVRKPKTYTLEIETSN